MDDKRHVAIVTDSTADLTPDLVEALDIAVVPLTISFGTETFKDGIDLTPRQFLDKLERSPPLPKTSQPSVSAFERVFREVIAKDQDVVCITISSDLSGTYNAARLAAEATSPIASTSSTPARPRCSWAGSSWPPRASRAREFQPMRSPPKQPPPSSAPGSSPS
jgi:hypothetical protein